MLIKQLHYSGASKMFLWVANALAERGLDVTVLTYMKSDGTTPSDIVKWENLEYLENKNVFHKYKAIRKYIKQTSPDLCISFLLDANILNIFSCLNLKTKSIVCERNDPFKSGYYKLKLLKPFFALADGAVFQLKDVVRYYNNIKKPTAVIPNPVKEIPDVTLKPIEERDNIIVSIGRLDIFQKRQDVLIKAFHMFHQKYPNYKLLIFGDGTDKDISQIESLISLYNLDDCVLLKGVTNEPIKELSRSKIFVFTSDFEGIPNSLVEAMSLGLPCVATDCRPGGAKLLINDGDNGFLVPKGDYMAIADKMCKLVDNIEFAERMGIKAKDVIDRFNGDSICDMWIDYLESL